MIMGTIEVYVTQLGVEPNCAFAWFEVEGKNYYVDAVDCVRRGMTITMTDAPTERKEWPEYLRNQKPLNEVLDQIEHDFDWNLNAAGGLGLDQLGYAYALCGREVPWRYEDVNSTDRCYRPAAECECCT